MTAIAPAELDGRLPAIPDEKLAELPALLMGYQQRWLADDSPLKIMEKSRRTGITWAEAGDNVLTAASAASAGGMNVYYIAYNQDMTIEYIQACAAWARAFNHAAGEIEEGIWAEGEDDKNIKTYTIHFPDSVFRIVALSSRPSNLRGRQGLIVIDEAAFHDALTELLKAAMAMLIWGGKVHVISTHNGDSNPFNELINDIRAGKQSGSIHRVTFDDAIGDGLYRRVCLRRGIEWTPEGEAAWRADIYKFYGAGASEELDVVPSNGSGQYLSRALIELRMSQATPVLRYAQTNEFTLLPDHVREADVADWCETNLKRLLAAIPAGAISFLGEDFARSGDLSVFAPLIQQQTTVRRAPFVVELRNMPFDQQWQILRYILDRLPHFTGAALDARGNGQWLAEKAIQRYGVSRIQAVMLTESWYRENMPAFKAAFEDGTITDIPADSDILADLRAFSLVRGVARIPESRTSDQAAKKTDSGSQAKRHGDAGIAYVLAHYASRELNKGPVRAKSRMRRTAQAMLRGYS